MIALLISLIFHINCDAMAVRLYNLEVEFNKTTRCACISGDYLDEYKSIVKKDLKYIGKCDSLEARADSLWTAVKKYRN